MRGTPHLKQADAVCVENTPLWDSEFYDDSLEGGVNRLIMAGAAAPAGQALDYSVTLCPIDTR